MKYHTTPSSRRPASAPIAAAAVKTLLESLESRTLMSGTGLKAEYFHDANLSSPALTRIDQTVDFNWREGSPDASIAPDTFSARWTGQIEPKFSETYTFEATSDDGVRLWVDGQLVIDGWQDQSAAAFQGSIALRAGQKYDLKMEYYENGGRAVAALVWSSPSQAKQHVTATQPSSEPSSGSGTTAPSGVTFVLINADTDKAIGTLADGATIDYAAVGTRNLSIRADVSSQLGAQSVVFGLDGNARHQVESKLPYAILGDTNEGADYFGWSPSLGSHTVTVTPYTSAKGAGTALAPATVHFNVIDSNPGQTPTPTPSSPTPTPTPAPTPTPTPTPTPAPTPTPTPTPAPSTNPDNVTYKAPITITAGGTYSGNFQSLDASKAVITIATSEPVVIENAILRGKSHLIVIKAGVKANLTVRNVRGYGMNPNVDGKYAGRFLYADSFKTVDVRHSYMEGTSGIYLQGAAEGATVKVLYNEAKNIDGRKSNGNGGYRTPGNGGSSDDSFYRVQFFQINQSVLAGAEIAWNKVVNEAGKSRVEDNINIHRTSGTAANPILIHDNYINGAYPVNYTTAGFSGGGIITDGGWSDTRGETAFVKIYNNTILNTTNYGLAIATGHDNQIYNNRVFATGKVNGESISAMNVGIYIWDYSDDKDAGHYYNNYAYDNVVGWHKASGTRNDYYMPDDDGAKSVNNQKLSGSFTTAMEAGELKRWQDAVAAAGLTVGTR
jgi:hypothetical protein